MGVPAFISKYFNDSFTLFKLQRFYNALWIPIFVKTHSKRKLTPQRHKDIEILSLICNTFPHMIIKQGTLVDITLTHSAGDQSSIWLTHQNSKYTFLSYVSNLNTSLISYRKLLSLIITDYLTNNRNLKSKIAKIHSHGLWHSNLKFCFVVKIDILHRYYEYSIHAYLTCFDCIMCELCLGMIFLIFLK